MTPEQPKTPQSHSKASSIRPDGAMRVGAVQINGTTYFEVATAVKLMGGGRDVLLGDVRMSCGIAEALANLLLLAAKDATPPPL